MIDFYAHNYPFRLKSPCAEDRMLGLKHWRQLDGPLEEILPLLRDVAPVVTASRGRRIAEVRTKAIVLVQDHCRLLRRGWPFGPLEIREAMPVEEAESRAAALLPTLSEEHRRSVLESAERALAERVQPPDEDAEACRAYVVLQYLGAVEYKLQHVNPETFLTPLQEEIYASQLASPRPTPHLRFYGRKRTVGYFYRETDGQGRETWMLDFDESSEAREIDEIFSRFCETAKVPLDVEDPFEYMRPAAAFMKAAGHRVEVVP